MNAEEKWYQHQQYYNETYIMALRYVDVIIDYIRTVPPQYPGTICEVEPMSLMFPDRDYYPDPELLFKMVAQILIMDHKYAVEWLSSFPRFFKISWSRKSGTDTKEVRGGEARLVTMPLENDSKNNTSSTNTIQSTAVGQSSGSFNLQNFIAKFGNKKK